MEIPCQLSKYIWVSTYLTTTYLDIYNVFIWFLKQGGSEITGDSSIIQTEAIFFNNTSGTTDEENKPENVALITTKTTYNFTAKVHNKL